MIKVPRGVARSMALSHMLVGLDELLGVAVVGWGLKVALEEGTEKKFKTYFPCQMNSVIVAPLAQSQ